MRFTSLKVVALVGYASMCLAFSTPAGSRLNNRHVWASQQNQDEFHAWAAGLRRFGFNVSGRQLQDFLWDTTNAYLEHRNRWLYPFKWLPEQLGFSQSWRMFSNPQTSPSRLWVELDQGHGFTPLFIVGSTRYTWRTDFFVHHRIRKLLGRIGRAGRAPEYNELGRWLAREAAQEFPTASSLRISVYTWKTQPPSAGYTAVSEPELGRPGGKFARRKTFALDEFRR
jgi:hypothetical protein